MDSQRFDGLVRTFIASHSRRGLLAGTASVLMASWMHAFVVGETEARRRRKRKRRNKRKRRGGDAGGDQCEQTACNGLCVDVQSDPDNCGACDNACAADLACCDGRCRDLDRDNGNCGACGNECFLSGSRFCVCGACVFCPLGATLNSDTCTCDCPDGQTNCDGVCRDVC